MFEIKQSRKQKEMADFTSQLIGILGDGAKLIVRSLNTAGNFELEYGKMYECPGLSFKHLKALSELFGTDNIDVDNYANGGCETCDYGSDYGHTIQLREVTKNGDKLSELSDKDLMKK